MFASISPLCSRKRGASLVEKTGRHGRLNRTAQTATSAAQTSDGDGVSGPFAGALTRSHVRGHPETFTPPDCYRARLELLFYICHSHVRSHLLDDKIKCLHVHGLFSLFSDKTPQKTTETQIFFILFFFPSAFTYYPKAVGLWFYLSYIHGPLMVVASKKYPGLKSGK